MNQKFLIGFLIGLIVLVIILLIVYCPEKQAKSIPQAVNKKPKQAAHAAPQVDRYEYRTSDDDTLTPETQPTTQRKKVTKQVTDDEDGVQGPPEASDEDQKPVRTKKQKNGNRRKRDF